MDYVFSKKVGTDAKDLNKSDDISWKYLLRQVLVACSCWSLFFCMGLITGAPTVFIPQLRQANVTVTDDVASWLSSTFCYAGVPLIPIIAICIGIYGRKKISIFVFVCNIISFVVFYFSTSTTHLLITEVLFGISQAGQGVVTIIISSEYTSPKYRGIFLCIEIASSLWGIWVSNAIGIFTYWKYIPIIGFVVALFSLTAFFWPESPLWLAGKDRFEECKRAHRWLKGTSASAEAELEKIIQSQAKREDTFSSWKDLRFITRREFYAPNLISVVNLLLYPLSGKFVITMYAYDILKKINNNDSAVYTSMLIIDGVTVFSAYIGSYAAKFFRRRTHLLSTTTTAVCFLIIMSVYLYLVKLSIFSENVYLSIFLLAGFSVAISCGPMVLAASVFGELLPSKHRSISVLVISIFIILLHATSLKLGPMIIQTLGLPGTFLFYGLGSGICTILLYFYLPETKDKTLIEIEEYFRDKKCVDESRELVALKD